MRAGTTKPSTSTSAFFEVGPNYYRLNSWLEMAYEQKKQYDQAFEVCIKARSQLENNPDVITSLKKAYADGGWQAYWRMELEFSEDRIKRQDLYVNTPYMMARIYMRLGEKEKALTSLEKAYKDHAYQLVLLNVVRSLTG